MAATGIIEYLPVRDTELPIHQPPGTALDADAGRALRPPAPQPAPCLFYLLGYLGYKMEKRNIRNKLLFIPYYFLFMNINVIRGYSYLAKHKGTGAWEKAKRGAG